MAFTKRFWGVGKFLLLLGGLMATYLVFAVAGMRYARTARQVPVPDLSGRTPTEATRALTSAGLTLRLEEQRRIHPTITSGLVAEQEPPPGITTRRQRSVRVWLSAGQFTGVVPTLIGESERGARRRLEQEALVLTEVSEIRSDQYPTGAIVAQEPPPQTRGTMVSVLVNRGERGATYVMPDLIGVQSVRAAELLRARGFRVTVVGDHPYPGLPEGIVLRHSPRAGFQIAPGESISLEVSR